MCSVVKIQNPQSKIQNLDRCHGLYRSQAPNLQSRIQGRKKGEKQDHKRADGDRKKRQFRIHSAGDAELTQQFRSARKINAVNLKIIGDTDSEHDAGNNTDQSHRHGFNQQHLC